MADESGIHRDESGRLPAQTSPDCYPLLYMTADGGTLCPDCADGGNGSHAADSDLDSDCPDHAQWRIVGQRVHWEGPPEICDHCGGHVESAYGDPDSGTFTDAQSIRDAVDSGARVFWKNHAYQVIRDNLGRYLIRCSINGHCIGLTHRDGETLNGAPGDFYAADS